MTETTPHRPRPFGPLETAEHLTDAQIEEKTRALVDGLTMDEKISMMYGDLPFWRGSQR